MRRAIIVLLIIFIALAVASEFYPWAPEPGCGAVELVTPDSPCR